MCFIVLGFAQWLFWSKDKFGMSRRDNVGITWLELGNKAMLLIRNFFRDTFYSIGAMISHVITYKDRKVQ